MNNFKHDCIEAVLEGDSIVIRISSKYLTNIAMPASFEGITGYEDAVIIDKKQLIKDVLVELNREAEDGTTMIHLMLDEAITDAYDNGSEAFEG
jgi:hypothetical protein